MLEVLKDMRDRMTEMADVFKRTEPIVDAYDKTMRMQNHYEGMMMISDMVRHTENAMMPSRDQSGHATTTQVNPKSRDLRKLSVPPAGGGRGRGKRPVGAAAPNGTQSKRSRGRQPGSNPKSATTSQRDSTAQATERLERPPNPPATSNPPTRRKPIKPRNQNIDIDSAMNNTKPDDDYIDYSQLLH